MELFLGCFSSLTRFRRVLSIGTEPARSIRTRPRAEIRELKCFSAGFERDVRLKTNPKIRSQAG